MPIPDQPVRELLAANVKRCMDESTDLKTPRALAARCRWPASAGPKRRGKKLSERYIRYVVSPSGDTQPSPSLDVISAIATALGTQPWRLLVDDKQLRQWMVGKLFTTDVAVSDQHVERHLPPAPKDPRPQAQRKRRA